MSIMRCAVYARYSSDLQHDRSIDDQIDLCRTKAPEGWSVLNNHIYFDKAKSGASTLGRTGLENLLAAARQKPKPFDYVLIEDTSRLSRDMGQTSHIVQRLYFEGIHVLFVSQDIDTKTKQAYMRLGMSSIIDSQYREDLADKTLRGLCGAVKRGFNPGGRTYGYLYTPVPDSSEESHDKPGKNSGAGTRIDISLEEAKILRLIFRQYADGMSIRDITHQLNDRGVPPPSRIRQLANGIHKPSGQPGSIRGFFENRKYIGDWTYNKKKLVVSVSYQRTRQTGS